MKTKLTIVISFLLFFSTTWQKAMAGAVVAHCQYSSVGWVKTYGTENVEFNEEIKGGSMEELTKSCREKAQGFADNHPEQGAVAMVTVATTHPSH